MAGHGGYRHRDGRWGGFIGPARPRGPVVGASWKGGKAMMALKILRNQLVVVTPKSRLNSLPKYKGIRLPGYAAQEMTCRTLCTSSAR